MVTRHQLHRVFTHRNRVSQQRMHHRMVEFMDERVKMLARVHIAVHMRHRSRGFAKAVQGEAFTSHV